MCSTTRDCSDWGFVPQLLQTSYKTAGGRAAQKDPTYISSLLTPFNSCLKIFFVCQFFLEQIDEFSHKQLWLLFNWQKWRFQEPRVIIISLQEKAIAYWITDFHWVFLVQENRVKILTKKIEGKFWIECHVKVPFHVKFIVIYVLYSDHFEFYKKKANQRRFYYLYVTNRKN